MARKKKISKEDVYKFYMEYYLENGEAPKNVFQLAKAFNFNESDFYSFFGTIESVDKSIFKSFYDQTMQILHRSEDFAKFDGRNQLLSFYYTFFEILTANRSFTLLILKNDKQSTQFLKTISSIKADYIKFVKELDIEKLDFKDDRIEKVIGKTLEESLWIQFILCIKFWMDDDSASLEKTDIFIEKSINTGFELLNVKPLQSVIDLGKFLFHEKIRMN